MSTNSSYVTDSTGSWLSQFMDTAGNGLINSLTASITVYEDISATQASAGSVYTKAETDADDVYAADITAEAAKSSPDTDKINAWSGDQTNWNSFTTGMADTTSTESQASAAVGTAESSLINQVVTEINDVLSAINVSLAS